MGELRTQGHLQGDPLRAFIRHLLLDLRALEQMIAAGMIESGVRRIGAEQEVFLVDEGWRPANKAVQILQRVEDPHFTTELAQFNLEMNLDPLVLQGDALSRMEKQLAGLLAKAQTVAESCGAHVVLAGILPTIRKMDLTLESLTPFERYLILNDAINQMRGGPYELRIQGTDELSLIRESVVLEAANCSFQVHFQVGADEFANLYNIAQVVAAPVLAAATNSPLLFGRNLWRETRIALFQQAVDTRRSSEHLRESSPRVSFGRSWVRDSVLELFQEDVTRFRVIFGTDDREDPLERLAAGEVPKLSALRLHNGTCYRWNRPCYGITDGKPHLRIENRVLPSGPTPRDEIANAAFWFGLIGGLSLRYRNIASSFEFEAARGNFHLAARYGLATQFDWLGNRTLPAQDLILNELIPLAYEGLRMKGIVERDIQTYLGTIVERVKTRRTGSQWMLDSIKSMKGAGSLSERLGALTAAMVARQKEGKPVSEWNLAHRDESGGWQHNYRRVEQYMTTDIFSVHDDEPLDLVLQIMNWQRIRHVPVEDQDSRLVGMVSYRTLLRVLASSKDHGRLLSEPVANVMKRDLITVAPEALTLDAIRLMREHQAGMLPVVKEGRLVGIVTERDFMDLSRELIEQQLGHVEGVKPDRRGGDER